MEISLSQQLFTFAFSLLLGVMLGVLFELFRTVRSLFGGGTVAVFVQDILFWIVASFITYCFYIVFTKGIVRVFVIIGAAVGFYIYIKTLGKAVSFLFRQLLRPVKSLAKFIFKLSKRIFLRKNKKLLPKALETLPTNDV